MYYDGGEAGLRLLGDDLLRETCHAGKFDIQGFTEWIERCAKHRG
jgi:hypothetical protein